MTVRNKYKVFHWQYIGNISVTLAINPKILTIETW